MANDASARWSKVSVVAAFCLLSCLALDASYSPAAAADQVKIGIARTISDAGYYIADAMGFFREDGLDVSITAFNSASMFRRMVPSYCNPDGEVNVASLRKDLDFFPGLGLMEKKAVRVGGVVGAPLEGGGGEARALSAAGQLAGRCGARPPGTELPFHDPTRAKRLSDPDWVGHADGRSVSALLDSGAAVGRGGRAGWAAGARQASLRAAAGVSRHARARGRNRRVLRPPRRIALVRPQRGERAALRLSRLEIRRHRSVHRGSLRARGKRLLREDQADILSVR